MSHRRPVSSASSTAAPPVLHQDDWGTSLGQEHRSAIRRFAPPGSSVLDLGPGRGAATVWLREQGFRAIGLDIARYPEWRAHPAGWFCVGDAPRLPFRDKAFDCTVAFEVLEHCPRYEEALREILRCTRKRLILSVPDCDLSNALRPYNLVPAHWTDQTHCNFFVRETLREAVERAGFEVCQLDGCVKIKPNSYFWATLRAPRVVRKAGRFVCQRLRLSATYWSSILLVAEVPASPSIILPPAR